MSNNHSTPLKRCSTCKSEKPLSAFTKKKRFADGLDKECRCCKSKYIKQYYQRTIERRREYARGYVHPDPDRKKALGRQRWSRLRQVHSDRRKARYAEDAGLRERNVTRSREWAEKNIEHMRAKAREWYENNTERAKARVREYEQANPEKVKVWGRLRANQRRARLSGAGGKYTQADVLKLYKLQRGKCANCRTDLKGKYHTDHRLAVVLGGSNDPHNIELLCPTCNMRKSGKLPHIFAQEEGRLI